MAEESKVAQRVLEIVRVKGPVMPTEVSKEIGMDSILSAAILAELVGNNQVKLSSLKVGSTPLYYVPGQEEKLQNYTKYLHDKEKKACELLKSKVILRDKILEPVMRVALRQIKDFAVPLQVKSDEGEELFWRWYLTTNEEVEPSIKKMLGISKSDPKPVEKKIESTLEKQESPPDKQEVLKPVKKKPQDPGAFAKKVESYFASNKVDVVERLKSKRRSEVEFLISVPSPVGTVKYYCNARDKKTCNDGDLSYAYVQGQVHKLPVLFITTGKLTKKATAMLEKEFNSIIIKQI